MVSSDKDIVVANMDHLIKERPFWLHSDLNSVGGLRFFVFVFGMKFLKLLAFLLRDAWVLFRQSL